MLGNVILVVALCVLLCVSCGELEYEKRIDSDRQKIVFLIFFRKVRILWENNKCKLNLIYRDVP